MSETIIAAIISLAGTGLTGLIAYFALRNKTDQELRIKRTDADTEVTKEYIASLKSELTYSREEVKRKDEMINKANELLNQATRELHEMTIRFTKLEALYENAVDDLKSALEELAKFKQATTEKIERVQRELKP